MEAKQCLMCSKFFKINTKIFRENPVVTSSVSHDRSVTSNTTFSPSAIIMAVWQIFFEAFGFHLDYSYFSSSVVRSKFYSTKSPPVCIRCCNTIRQRGDLYLDTAANNQRMPLTSSVRNVQEEYDMLRSAIVMTLCQVQLTEGGHTNTDHENDDDVTATTTPTEGTTTTQNREDVNNGIKSRCTPALNNSRETDPGCAPIVLLRENISIDLTVVNKRTDTDTYTETDVATPAETDKLGNHEPNDGVDVNTTKRRQVFAVSLSNSELAKSKTNKRHQCQLCKKKVTLAENLKVHMRTHSGEKPFMCCVCSRRFNDKSNLATHKKLHTPRVEHTYTCDVCGKWYVIGARLRVHMRTHTGEVPYPCDKCDRSFATSSQRTWHKNKSH